MATHRLLTKSPATRRAICSECGDTDMAKKGKYWRCANKDRNRSKAWRQTNPNEARGHRATWQSKQPGRIKPHELLAKDMLTLSGDCRTCGEVDIRRHGRGWVCRSQPHCKCYTTFTEASPLWLYTPAGYFTFIELCEPCCYLLARGFASQGLIEPVIEMTWPQGRTAWDTAVHELEAA